MTDSWTTLTSPEWRRLLDRSMPDPSRIVVAGDWHGSADWAVRVISEAAELLGGEDQKLILHLGDFGIWPGRAGAGYVDTVHGMCLVHGISLWFIDGNHEDFTQIGEFRDIQPISWLPRGHRWTWHGRTWLACGGGVSLDRVIRTEGRDWWPQEEISDGQEAAVIAGGRADVMVTHDCPAGVRHSFPPPPSWWALADLARNDAHRERLQQITDAVRPSHLMHGHLHRAYSRICDFGYGPVSVTGLDRDGEPGNYAVLDVRTMDWSTL